MRGWFDHLIEVVENMIKEQIEVVRQLGSEVTKVMLIGGPASNDYFHKKLREGLGFGKLVESLPEEYLSVFL